MSNNILSRLNELAFLVQLALERARGGGPTPPSPFFVATQPINGATNDWPSLIGPGGTLATNAFRKTTWLAPGNAGEHFVANTPNLPVPNGSLIRTLAEGTSVVASMTNIGITSMPWVIVGNLIGGSVALIANVVQTPASSTVDLAAAPVGGVGSWGILRVGLANLSGGLYQVQSITPILGGFRVGVDRPIIYPATTLNANWVDVVPAEDITLAGPMHVSGDAAGYIEVDVSHDVHVSDFTCDASGAHIFLPNTGFQIDTFSLRGRFDRIEVNGDGQLQNGMWLIGESHEGSELTVHDCTNSGILFSDSWVSTYKHVTAYRNNIGLNITSDGAALGLPSEDVTILGGSSYGNNVDGIVVQHAAKRTTIVGVASRQNNRFGFNQFSGAAPGAPTGTKLIGCRFSENDAGMQVDGGDLQVQGCDASDNTVNGVYATGTSRWDVAGLKIHGTMPNGVLYSDTTALFEGTGIDVQQSAVAPAFAAIVCEGTSTMRISGSCRLDGNGVAVAAFSAGRLTLRDFTIDLQSGGACTGLDVAGTAVAYIDNLRIQGSGPTLAASTGINVHAGATVRLGDNVVLPAALGTAITVAGGAFLNRGRTQLNNLVAVAVPFPDLQLEDRVKITKDTDATVGGPFVWPLVIQTAGVGFTLTGEGATDNSFINWSI